MNVYIVILVFLLADDKERSISVLVTGPENVSDGDLTAAAFGNVTFDHIGLLRSEIMKLSDTTIRNIGLIAKGKNLI